MKKWSYSRLSSPWTSGFRVFVFFLIVFTAINLFLGQQKVLNLPPQGIHLWRQADGLTFTYNYYKDGIHVFQPRLNNLLSEGGYGACEFPMIYVFVAFLYKIFGPHTLIFRLVNLLIVFFGFYCLFRLISMLLGDMLQGLALSLIFFASSILIYYSTNFLPDPPALGFILMGWWFFFRYISKPAYKDLVLCFLFFLLGSLIKVTFAINPLAAIGIFFVEWIWGIRTKEEGRTILHPRTFIALSLISAVLVVAWNSWMLNYNLIHGSGYFLTRPKPIWQMKATDIANNWKLITEYWYTKYYYESIFHFFLLSFMLGLFWFMKAGRVLVFLSLFLILGGLSYIMLFFEQFGQRDYYALNIMTVILFPVITTFVALRRRFPKIVGSWIMTFALLVLGILGIQYAKLNLHRRYDPIVSVETGFNTGFYSFKPFLDKAGVKTNAKVVSIPDPSPNITLYFLDRQGWTIPPDASRMPDTLRYFIRLGAEYLVISDTMITHRKDMQRFLLHKLVENKGITLYKLYPTMDSLQCLFLPTKPLTWATRFK